MLTFKKFRKNGRIIKVLKRKRNDFVFGGNRTWPIFYTDAFGIFVRDNGIIYILRNISGPDIQQYD